MRVILALPFHGFLGLLYLGLAVLLMPFFAFTFAEVLKASGLHPLPAYLTAASLTLLSLVASPVNLVVYTFSRRSYAPVVEYITVFGMPIPIPRVVLYEERSYLAVNVGGALIPLAVATYLLVNFFTVKLAASILAASILIYLVSRVVPAVGVVTPAVAPPLIALLAALPAGGGPVVTYITAVYGTIIGADLLNLKKILKYRPPLMSIGGAGVFDGIFLSGVLATLLSTIF